MTSDKIFSWLAVVVISLLFLTTGCAPLDKEAAETGIEPEKPTVEPKVEPKVEARAEPKVEAKAKPEVETKAEPEKQVPETATVKAPTLALKFTPQESTTYKVTAQSEMSLKFEGSLADDDNFKDSRKHNRVEMTFTQQIQSVDDQGNAVAKITIKGLKYFSIDKNTPVLDFDDSSEEDKGSPLAKLIGQSYTIKIAPTGKVIKVIDVKQAQTVVKGRTPADRAALGLLSPDAIKRLHGTLVLPDADKNQLNPGDNWSSVRTFPFPLIGPKSYERIYTLKEIKDHDNQRIAIVEMDAILTLEMAEGLHKERITGAFSEMLDNIRTYTGQLTFDLTTGKVENCLEELRSEWIMVDPDAGQKGDKEPDAFIMGAIRLYSLERID